MNTSVFVVSGTGGVTEGQGLSTAFCLLCLAFSKRKVQESGSALLKKTLFDQQTPFRQRAHKSRESSDSFCFRSLLLSTYLELVCREIVRFEVKARVIVTTCRM